MFRFQHRCSPKPAAVAFEGMKIELDWEIAERPHRIGEIAIDISLPGELPDQQRETLERVAHACLIHNTLTHPPAISLHLTTPSR